MNIAAVHFARCRGTSAFARAFNATCFPLQGRGIAAVGARALLCRTGEVPAAGAFVNPLPTQSGFAGANGMIGPATVDEDLLSGLVAEVVDATLAEVIGLSGVADCSCRFTAGNSKRPVRAL
eukprot:gnl/MRDRNA2_/MRDRNA2_112610_c0_seq1.p2 gnl/MRDRNA2_/MRDRNA2_112610_c0~~gnl/MRDRNA2_/MRDRNA2_112610_c0_seq1.p2  ORF type:complete len:122 (-),score=21.00 gnl/MRDRNA2_/MRDRNA2_112610_c0_seq1:155-520(-)